MKKWFVLLIMVMLICVSVMVNGVAEGLSDEYELNPAGWPNKHWAYMGDEEIAQYESAGWQRYTGFLWYNSEHKYAADIDTMGIVNVADIDSYYNQGYTLHVIYHWLLDGRLIGKHTEQSVYAGRYVLSKEQAVKVYNNDMNIPEDTRFTDSLPEYYSLWLYNGKECSEPADSELNDNNYSFARIVFDTYDYGYGSKLYLRNGEIVEFTLKEILDLGYVDYEMIHWE